MYGPDSSRERECVMSKNVIDLTSKSFDAEVMNSKIPVLIDFWATWCMPCRMVAPTLEALADEYVSKAKVCKVNVDDEPDLASKFGIMSIPTVVVIKEGKITAKSVGAQSKQAYADMLAK
jgi:thioredoxin 1